ncbi:hypothetical protein GQ53DRAFT_827938 [Thozetella sp. PMI_491]|nr:hypothetical protein GQ53DRAFT_827938 [Thozetella sp. PMI_491]
MIAATLEDGFGPISGRGLAEWDNIHVHDLSGLIMLLVSRAASSEIDIDETEIWGPKAYYFAENGTHRWSKMAEVIVNEAHNQGLVSGTETREFSLGLARQKGTFDWLSWGLNSKGAARRARKYLDWEPKCPSLQDCIPEMVRAEATRKKQA